MSLFGWSLPPGCGTLPGEETGAYEVQIDGVRYAWGEDDLVYVQDAKHPDAGEDGYRLLGKLEWPDDDDPVAALRVFINHKEK